ncbi:MAG: ABC transporter ATP-binding protein [Verrucomicrobia bacterium]|nr:MAG: ABC transporter ATP-binding protein [Verrucomicrobiota bacterium]
MIEVEDVWKSFDDGKIQVLKGVSLTVERGELLALCGTSGCGKSTLLSLIAGLESSDRGRIVIDGRERATEAERVSLLRREIGFVFQLHHLMPDLTLAENCLIPVIAVGTSMAQAKIRMTELAELTGVGHRLDRPVRELSGGERQRGALVRALMNDPQILLADEPTGALDEENREIVFQLLLDLTRKNGKTLIMATHDQEMASRCDRVLRMRDGAIIAS